MTDDKKKLKGFSPYNDKADNYNIDISDIFPMAEAANISDRNKLINFIILSFVKMSDFAKTRDERDYREAKRLLNVVLELLGK